MNLQDLSKQIKTSFDEITGKQPSETELMGMLAWAELLGRYGQAQGTLNGQTAFVQTNNPGRLYVAGESCGPQQIYDTSTWFGTQGEKGQCVTIYDTLAEGVDAWVTAVAGYAPVRQAIATGDAGALADIALTSGTGGYLPVTAANWEKGAGFFLSAVSSVFQQLRGYPMQTQLWSIKSTPSYAALAGPSDPVSWQDLTAAINQLQTDSGAAPLKDDVMLVWLAYIGVASNQGLHGQGKQTNNFGRVLVSTNPAACPPGSLPEAGTGCLATYGTVRQGLEAMVADLKGPRAAVYSALLSNDPGKIAAAMLEAGMFGPANKNAQSWETLRNGLAGFADQASKAVMGNPKPPYVLPISSFVPPWAVGKAPGPKDKGKGTDQAAGQPSARGLSTGQMVALGAGVIGVGGLGLYLLLRKPVRGR